MSVITVDPSKKFLASLDKINKDFAESKLSYCRTFLTITLGITDATIKETKISALATEYQTKKAAMIAAQEALLNE